MKIGPKYKIARRLGAPIFEKTQTQKYVLRSEKKLKNKSFSGGKTEYGNQLNEKQKVRLTYLLSERQFSNYVREVILKKSANATQTIFQFLELRLDSVAFRIGFASTRSGAKQIVSHGHIKVNGKRVNIPSLRLRIGDKIEINERSANKPLFDGFSDRLKAISIPSWIKFDENKRVAEITGLPNYSKAENMFDLNTVLELYSRS
jgi:small subunit ribosomal protein S4